MHLICRCPFEDDECVESHHAAEDEQTRALGAANNLCKAVVAELMQHVKALHHQKEYTTYTVDSKELAAAYTRSPGELRGCVISNVSPQTVDHQHQLFAPRMFTKAQPTQALTVYHEHKLWPDEEPAVYYADRKEKAPTVCHTDAIENYFSSLLSTPKCPSRTNDIQIASATAPAAPAAKGGPTPSLPNFSVTTLAVPPKKYTHPNILRQDGVNDQHRPILCHHCLFYTESKAWNCVKCNSITTGNKFNVYKPGNCTKCDAAGRHLKHTLLPGVGPHRTDICMHPLCVDYYGMPPGAYREGGHENKEPVTPTALVSAIHDMKGDSTRVQNKYGPAYGPAVTYPPGATNNVESSPNTKPGWIITKTNKDSERKSNVCVGDWRCTRCLTHNSYHEEHCYSCNNRKPIPEHNSQRYNWPYAYSDRFGTYIGRNELAQEVTGVVMRVKPGGSWAHQIESLQVLALQPATDSGNTNIQLPWGSIMGNTWHGYTSPEDDDASLWRTIQMDSGYNMPHRQAVDKGPTISWYDTLTKTADGQQTATIGATIVYTIHSGYKLTWDAPPSAPHSRIVWVDVTNTDEAIQNLAHRSYIKNAFANAYSMVENLKGKARDLPEGSTYSTPFRHHNSGARNA